MHSLYESGTLNSARGLAQVHLLSVSGHAFSSPPSRVACSGRKRIARNYIHLNVCDLTSCESDQIMGRPFPPFLCRKLRAPTAVVVRAWEA